MVLKGRASVNVSVERWPPNYPLPKMSSADRADLGRAPNIELEGVLHMGTCFGERVNGALAAQLPSTEAEFCRPGRPRKSAKH